MDYPQRHSLIASVRGGSMAPGTRYCIAAKPERTAPGLALPGNPSRTNPSRRSAAAGFTIAELLAVVLIMVILMGMAVGSFYGMGRGSRMRGAVSSFNAVLSLTRQFAVTRTTPMDVVLLQTDGDVFGYQVRRHDDGTPFRPLQFLPPGMRFEAVNVPGIGTVTDFTDPGFVFTYWPDGSLKDIDETLMIQISDETDQMPVTFSINGLTGLIRVDGD